MSPLQRRTSELIEDFIREQSRWRGVIGIMLFGSYAKDKARSTSDVDLLVVRRDINAYSRTKRTQEGITLEVHEWPQKIFERPFEGEATDALSYAYILEMMRTGEILYDPGGTLRRFKRQAETQSVPAPVVASLVGEVRDSLYRAQDLIRRNEIEGAEIETRGAAEGLGRVMLLKRGILEINPPKTYLPYLRSEVTDFYETFRDVQNFDIISWEGTEHTIDVITGWLKKTLTDVRGSDDEAWLRRRISDSEIELSNAKDCMPNVDLEAAALEVRRSAMLLGVPILKLSHETTPSAHSAQYMELIRNHHPYGEAMRLAMNFINNEQALFKQFWTLKDTVRQL